MTETHEEDTLDAGADQDHHFILGTAGHIDHGKTSLVSALTSVDLDRIDRLPEERERGMTIDLGFADLTIGDTRFSVVDVPGHERFVRTMVAGASGIDMALIVVAADDSVMPQTIEHVEILHLLGVTRAIVVITKIDTVERDMVELVAEEVGELLCDTPLTEAVCCPVSSITREGLDELKLTISKVAEELRSIRGSRALPPFHMPIDRVFTVAGRGTVVTGSPIRGRVLGGDTLELWPSGRTCRVRDLQSHGSHHDELTRGQRVAINLSGIEKEVITRGCELATPGYLAPSRMLGVKLQCLASSSRALKSSSVVRLGMGTREVPVRVVLLDRAELLPGESTFAQLRAGTDLACSYGQRFIIRDETASRTIGGGVVLSPSQLSKRRVRSLELEALERMDVGNAVDRVEQVLRSLRFARPSDLRLCALTGVELADVSPTIDRLEKEGRWIQLESTSIWLVPETIDDLAERLVRRLTRFHARFPDQPGPPQDAAIGWLERFAVKSAAKPLFDRYVAKGVVKLFGRFACLPEFAPKLSTNDQKLLNEVVLRINEGRFQPPLLDTLSGGTKGDRKRLERLASLAVASGELVKIATNLYLHFDRERELRRVVSDLIEQNGGASVADLRESLQSSRKYTVPFMEYLDRVGFTRRVDDSRVLAEN